MNEGDRVDRRFAAHAKVNLFLSVGALRPDGYHEVVTVLQALDLADDVTVVRTDGDIAVTCEPEVCDQPEDNLAYRAVSAWRARLERGDGAQVRIAKRIPSGAGLGGGSADAAAVLAALGPWDGPDRPLDPRLRTVASGLGADVAFFLGRGTQLMGGRGDDPIEVLPTPDLDLVLLNPGVPAATGAVYRRFDPLDGTPASRDRMLDAIRADDAEAVAAAMYNDLTRASISMVPEIAVALRFIQHSDRVLGAVMAGSGSTVLGVCSDRGSAESCALAARERGWWARAARTVDAGIERVDVASLGRTDRT